jgi:small subunit ribosomal protein S20
MANIKSAKKRAKQAEKRRLRNKSVKTNLKTTEKKFHLALSAGGPETALDAFNQTAKKFDKAAAKGVIHKNAANRKKSRLAKKLHALAQSENN